MRIDIITPEKTLFSSENAQSVICPGIEGSFQLLENHAPIISALKKGELTVVENRSNKTFTIASGLLECSKNTVNILVEE
jgi:F-type H+-transporting ATPase subunit epsilon